MGTRDPTPLVCVLGETASTTFRFRTVIVGKEQRPRSRFPAAGHMRACMRVVRNARTHTITWKVSVVVDKVYVQLSRLLTAKLDRRLTIVASAVPLRVLRAPTTPV